MVDSFFIGNFSDGPGVANAEGSLIFDIRGISLTVVVQVCGFIDVGSRMTSLVEFGFAFGTRTSVL